MVTATQAEVVDSMEAIIPLAPMPARRPAPADKADADQTREMAPLDREAERGDEVDNRLAFLAHLGASVRPDPPAHGAVEAKTGLAAVPATATAIARQAVLSGNVMEAPAAGLDIADGTTTPGRIPSQPASALSSAEPPASPLPIPIRADPAGIDTSGMVQVSGSIRAAIAASDTTKAASAGAADRLDQPDPTKRQGDRATGVVGDAGRATGQTAEPAAPAPRADMAFALRYPSALPAADGATLPAAASAQAARARMAGPATPSRTGNPKGPEALPASPLASAPATDTAALPARAAAPEAVPIQPAGAAPTQSPAAVGDDTKTPATTTAVAEARPVKAAASQPATDRDGRTIAPEAAPAGAEPANGITADRSADGDWRPADFAIGADGLPAATGDPARDAQGHTRTPAHGARPAGTPTLPAGLGHHLADIAARFPDRPVELTLSPEELGRVRMSFTTGDGALTMSLVADRPETLDLLRRHIDVLAQDFRDLGFANLSFSFAQGGESSQPEAETIAGSGPPDEATPVPAPARHAPARPAGGGLDLRL